MLTQQMRQVLLWVTAAVVVVVVVSGMASVLTFLIHPERRGAFALAMQPAEVALCQGEQVVFTADSSLEDMEWAATGGTVDSSGLYTAGELPGDYEVQVAGAGGERGRAIVHVGVCTPTPTPVPTSTYTPVPTPTLAPTPIPEVDPRGDAGTYTAGSVVAQPPGGVDIRNASVAADGRVVLGAPEGLPTELAEWAQEGEVVLWISLYEPIPDSLTVRTDWLFVLDLDGNTATGRPVGSVSINPDLGDEVAIGVYYDPLGMAYVPYFLVWDPAVGNWQERSGARYHVGGDRTLVGLAVSLDVLQQAVSQVTGVTVAADAARGRAGAIAYIAPEAVVDFYPALP